MFILSITILSDFIYFYLTNTHQKTAAQKGPRESKKFRNRCNTQNIIHKKHAIVMFIVFTLSCFNVFQKIMILFLYNMFQL